MIRSLRMCLLQCAALTVVLLAATRGSAQPRPAEGSAPAAQPDAPVTAEAEDTGEVSGEPPAAPPDGQAGAPAAEPAAPPEPAPDPAELAPIEVVVEGYRPMPPGRSAGQHTYKHREIERLPGAFGDALRAIEVLPGVTPLLSGLPHFTIRGSMPSATAYYIDGIRVPFLYHLAVGPSVIHHALVHGVDFFPGPYPAMYGGHIGGVIAAQTPPPAYRVRGLATIRAFDAGAFIEAPFFDGQADAFAAGRYSYTAALLNLFAPGIDLSYWDYQAGGSVALTPFDRLRLFVFGSEDYLGEVLADDTKQELFGVQFHRLNLRLDHAPPRTMAPDAAKREPLTRTSVTLGHDRSGLGTEGEMITLGLGFRSDAELPLHDLLRLRAGTSLQIDSHDFEPTARPQQEEPTEEEDPEALTFDISNAFVSERTHELGAYVDLVIRPLEQLELVPGLRADLFAEGAVSQAAVDPRATVRVRPLPWLTSVSAFGVAHQRPALIVSVPGLDPRAMAGGVQEVVQLSQGAVVALPEDIEAQLTGFIHWYSNLTDLAATCTSEVDACSIGDRSDGRAVGLEILLRRSLTERIGGLISYTLSRAERTARGRTTLADLDRAHVLHLALGVDLGRGWHAGARLTAYTGRPYSLIAFDDPDHPDRATLIGKRNALRREGFHRIDVRLEKRWQIGEHGFVSVVLEGVNVTARKEMLDFDCRMAEALAGRGGLTCGGQEIGPLTIPSIGVSGGF